MQGVRRTCFGWFVRLGVVCALLAPAVAAAEDSSPSPADIEFFEREVRPLLLRRCYECHSAEAKKLKGGLRLDGRAEVLKGGDSGPAVEPGQPDASLLIEAVRYDGLEMPPTGKLPAAEVAVLEEWVRRGAAMPAGDAASDAKPAIDFEAGRQFWSFRPLRVPAPPAVTKPDWPKQPIDEFVLAELERRGLAPSPEADRRTLIRRVYFDLIGLPPVPEEVEAFVADERPDAYERLVERLLASPHYGERLARYWLDLARYSDATASWLDSLAQAWLYRDWVVRALNEDLPYDRFVRLQLAADQVPGSQPADIAALGFLGLSPTYWKELKLDPEVIKGTVAEEWEERVDAIGRTFLGLTVACARCHDHKFDPIGTEDYYALAGVLANTRLIDRPVVPEAEFAAVRAAREEVKGLKEQIAQLEAAKPADAQQKIGALKERIRQIETETPGYQTSLAHAVDDAALLVEADGPDATKLTYKPGEAIDVCMQIRGNPSNPGPEVPRHFLTVLSAGTPRPFTRGSGRGELAEAIVTDAAPLAARVIVNRVWAQHFGRGLVETTSDFGAQGSAPSHPELLEYLAARFVAGGWSLKSLHREIVLSATYRQESRSTGDVGSNSKSQVPNPKSIDPENRLLWRMNRRRLEIEVWRDAILAADGTLDTRMGGPAFDLKQVEGGRRTVYGRVDRYELDDMLRLYDFPDPLGHSPGREPTTTPLQQLFVLNSPFMRRHAGLLAERVAAERAGDVEGQVRRAYELLFGRDAGAEELRVAEEFLGNDPDAERWREYAQVLLGSNEFLFVD